MPFELQTDSDIASELRRIAAEQAERGLSALARGQAHPPDEVDTDRQDPWDEGVHDARKRCKKIRAIARLCRDALGDGYHGINEVFRDTARLMSDARDAWTMIATVDRLIEMDLDILPPEELQQVRQALVDRYTSVRRAAVERGLLTDAEAAMTQAAAGIPDWPLPPSLRASDLRDSLARVRGRGRERWKELREQIDGDPMASTDVAHEMRKRVKYLRYQLEVLEQAWPDVLEAHSDAFDELGSLLGEDHDLAVLTQVVSGEELVDPALAEKLASAVALHRHRLRRRITELADQTYAEPTDAFADRIVDYLDLRLS